MAKNISAGRPRRRRQPEITPEELRCQRMSTTLQAFEFDLRKLHYCIRNELKLDRQLQRFGRRHIKNWPNEPNRFFGLTEEFDPKKDPYAKRPR